jgi:hypothetical protein
MLHIEYVQVKFIVEFMMRLDRVKIFRMHNWIMSVVLYNRGDARVNQVLEAESARRKYYRI